MLSRSRSNFPGCATCNFCMPSRQPQTLMPQNFVSHKSKSFFVVTDGLIFGNLASIPFDPCVDPGPYTCFNCWRRGDHSHFECNKPEFQYFCQNCGRKGVTMNDCPRCALAYLEFSMEKMELRCRDHTDGCSEVKQLWSPKDKKPRPIRGVNYELPTNCMVLSGSIHHKELQSNNSATNSVAIRGVNYKPPTHSAPSWPSCSTQYPAKTHDIRIPVAGPFNLYLKALRDVVVQSVDGTKIPNTPAEKGVEITDLTTSINCSKSTVSSGIGEEYLSDGEGENLDQILVDEDEKPQLDEPPSEGVREFMNLMDAVRHLPIDAQSSVALQFVRKRHVLMNEKKEQVVDKR